MSDSHDQEWGGPAPLEKQPLHPQTGPSDGPGPAGPQRSSGDFGTVEDSTALFGELSANFKEVIAALKGAPLKLFLGIQLLALGVNLLYAITAMVLGLMGSLEVVIVLLLPLVSLVGMALGVLSSAIQVSLFSVIRHVKRGGHVDGVSGAFEMIKPLIVPSLLVSLVAGGAVSLGISCCIVPGIIAVVFLWPARYLVGGRGMGLGEAFSTSVAIGKKYWLLLAASMGGWLVLGFVMLLVGGGMIAIIDLMTAAAPVEMLHSPNGRHVLSGVVNILTQGVIWAFLMVFMVILWIGEGSVMKTIEDDYFGDALQEDLL